VTAARISEKAVGSVFPIPLKKKPPPSTAFGEGGRRRVRDRPAYKAGIMPRAGSKNRIGIDLIREDVTFDRSRRRAKGGQVL